MTPNEYQQAANRTNIDPNAPTRRYYPAEIYVAWHAIGLAGEAGEVADHVKKGVFHEKGVNMTKLAEELGDVLWYVAALATVTGFTLEEIMQMNIDKLAKRYPQGWDSSRSHAPGTQPIESR